MGEIKKVAKKDAVLAAEGAVIFFERLSPAIEQVDSSSGAIGSAVGRAVSELTPLIANAPADAKMREAWLERLFEAYLADEIPYLERLGDEWGELCGSEDVASSWADRLLDIARAALSPNGGTNRFQKGTMLCLSAMFRAGRFDELIDLLRVDCIWNYRQWAVRAMAAKGLADDAILFAESCRGRWSCDQQIDLTCEEILLAAGRIDEAYTRYGIRAPGGGTYLASFRAMTEKYAQIPPARILMDLARSTPGDEGKWFAAAKDAGLFQEALALAGRSPCDPRTLTRAARDFAEKEPAFALRAGFLAMHWLVQGYGYEITGLDVWAAYDATMQAAAKLGNAAEAKVRIRQMLAAQTAAGHFAAKILGGELA